MRRIALNHPVHAVMVEDFASLAWRIARGVRTETELVSDHSREKGEDGVKVIRVGIADEMEPFKFPDPSELFGSAKREEPDKPEEKKRKRTVRFLPLPTERIDALGRQEHRLRRHWLRLYHELERRRSLALGEPIPPRLVVELE